MFDTKDIIEKLLGRMSPHQQRLRQSAVQRARAEDTLILPSNLDVFSSSWAGLSWSPWVPFTAPTADWRILPTVAGLYRVRVVGGPQLSYIGQTGRSLRERVRTLARQSLGAAMPFNDLYSAAPGHWALRVAEGLEFKVSVAPSALPERDRLGQEDALLWLHRLAVGSTLCNYGRFHPRYTKSGPRAQGQRGQRLPDGERNPASGPPSVPLRPRSAEAAPDWMGLSWSPSVPVKDALAQRHAQAGLYRVTDASGVIIYIGQSAHLGSRWRGHMSAGRFDGWPDAQVSFAFLAPASAPPPTHHLLEQESDLLGAFFVQHSRAPAAQYGQ